MKNTDYIVQNKKYEFDTDILHRKLFDVNIRLYKNNKTYFNIVNNILKYMDKITTIKFDDYPAPKGISGANIGIPFNIIGVMKNNKMNYFLNPRILEKSLEFITTTTNCGSVKLKKPIHIKRHRWIKVGYYDLNGRKHTKKFNLPYSAVMQHEIDHNNGILITGRQIKTQGKE